MLQRCYSTPLNCIVLSHDLANGDRRHGVVRAMQLHASIGGTLMLRHRMLVRAIYKTRARQEQGTADRTLLNCPRRIAISSARMINCDVHDLEPNCDARGPESNCDVDGPEAQLVTFTAGDQPQL